MRKVIILFILVSCSSFTYAEKDILVAVSAYDGTDIASEYYGEIDKETYDSITSKLSTNKMVMMKNVFWINEEGKIERMSTTSRNGHRFGYTNTVFLKEDSITRIVVLDKKYLDKLDEK